MNDSRQVINKIDWLDEQRRKDRKMAVVLREHINTLQKDNKELVVKIAAMETEIKNTQQLVMRSSKVDEIVDQNRSEFMTRIDNIESLRTKAEIEIERLRILDMDAINKSINQLQDSIGKLRQLEEQFSAKNEEENRIRNEISDLKLSINKVVRVSDESEHTIVTVEERSRQDNKRISDFNAEINNLRRLLDEIKPKLESTEDTSLRNHNDIKDLVALENDRKMMQDAWIENQSVVSAERERWWLELQNKSKDVDKVMQDSSSRMEEFGDTHRDMKQALSSLDKHLNDIKERITEVSEVQRHKLGLHKKDWQNFVSENEKQWTNHMLERAEKWKENERITQRHIERVEIIEEAVKEISDIVKHMQTIDQERLKEIFTVVRKYLAIYDKPMRKVP